MWGLSLSILQSWCFPWKQAWQLFNLESHVRTSAECERVERAFYWLLVWRQPRGTWQKPGRTESKRSKTSLFSESWLDKLVGIKDVWGSGSGKLPQWHCVSYRNNGGVGQSQCIQITWINQLGARCRLLRYLGSDILYRLSSQLMWYGPTK